MFKFSIVTLLAVVATASAQQEHHHHHKHHHHHQKQLRNQPDTPRFLADLFDIDSTLYGLPIPDCGDKGQEEAFQGRDLVDNKGQCTRINICHGTAGGGPGNYKWNKITVSRNKGLPGHREKNHNEYDGKGKLPDYYPMTTSVPNPNGAGKYGSIDGECNFVPDETDDDNTDDPSPGPSPTKAPTYITGDPHIRKFNGETYDFHGGCDLVLLHNPDFNNGQGLHIHVRTKIHRWWSSIESAAIQIGEDTLEIKGGIESRKFWVNGVEGRFETSTLFPFQIGLFGGRYRYISDRVVQYKLFLPYGQSLMIRSIKDILRVELSEADEDYFGYSLGLMGSFTDGALLARNGTATFKDTDAFGQHWQVRDTDPQLFHEAEGPQYPEKCAMPSTEFGASVGRRLGATITKADAEKACRHVDKSDRKNCVYDCLAMNDLDAAEGY